MSTWKGWMGVAVGLMVCGTSPAVFAQAIGSVGVSTITTPQAMFLVSSDGITVMSLDKNGNLLISLKAGAMPLTSITFFTVSPLVSVAPFSATVGFPVTNPVGQLLSVQSSYLFSNLAASTTSTVKVGAGVFHTLTINTRGTGSTVVMYDSLTPSGTIIATVDTTLSTTAFLYDAAFSTGLVWAATGAGAANLTVTYR